MFVETGCGDFDEQTASAERLIEELSWVGFATAWGMGDGGLRETVRSSLA